MKKQFSFDDTLEYDKEDLTENNDLHASQFSTKTQRFDFSDIDNETINSQELDDQDGENDMKKTKKGKKKMKLWVKILIGIVALIIAFLVYIFAFSGNSDGPVYGNRCASLIAIDDNKLKSSVTAMKNHEAIDDVQVKVACRTIKVTYKIRDGVSSPDAKAIVIQSLHAFDQSMGQGAAEGSAWSTLFNKSNGRLQYDIDIIIKMNSYTIFGTKHAGSEDISFTDQSLVADQASADKAIQRQQEVDAANPAQSQSQGN